jgi:hypothetical protein
MSIFIGVLSVLTSYFWWTVDWWQPENITHTKVGIEDFIMGFVTGGIMSVIYTIVFNKKYKKQHHKKIILGSAMMLALAIITFVIIELGATTFWASVISMSSVGIIILLIRRDLLVNSIASGALMVALSLPFYLLALVLNPVWYEATYLHGLSGITLLSVPIEEFIFWFLAGFLFGPLYEFVEGLK